MVIRDICSVDDCLGGVCLSCAPNDNCAAQSASVATHTAADLGNFISLILHPLRCEPLGQVSPQLFSMRTAGRGAARSAAARRPALGRVAWKLFAILSLTARFRYDTFSSASLPQVVGS